jgi:peptide/nickel transport system permease protein
MDRTERLDMSAVSVPASRTADSADEVDLTPIRTYWQLVRQRFAQHRLAVIALVVLSILVTGAVVVPLLTGNQYRLTNLTLRNAGPSLAAPLGYDHLGQNIFLRLMKATQTSLTIGVAAVFIIVGIGSVVGSIAGYAGGVVDNVLMRFVDVVLSLPVLFIILMIVALFGSGNVWVVIIAIGITGWTLAARLIRAEFLSLREADFVQAARALGAGHRRIIMRHMLPSAMAPLVVAAALGVADSVVTEGALSFLGYGISPPDASLGNMLNTFNVYFSTAPERILYPGVVLVLIVLCASFLGDGLRDALDPRQRIESK